MQNVRNCEGSEVIHCLQASKVACHFRGSWQETRDIWVRAKDFIIHVSRQRELSVFTWVLHAPFPGALFRGEVGKTCWWIWMWEIENGRSLGCFLGVGLHPQKNKLRVEASEDKDTQVLLQACSRSDA